MRELQTGVWHWEAPHPEWRHEDWDCKDVSSYAIDDGVHLLLFDPLAVPDEIFELAAKRETAIVLTSPWHRCDAVSLAQQFDAILDALQPLRELPVELVLPTHGPPADREALERALAG